MDWSLIASVVWKISLGILLLALSVLVAYVCAVLGSIRNSLDSIRDTLKSTESLVDKEVTAVIREVDQSFKEVNKELPQILKNVNGITASLQEISEVEIQPTAHNIRQMTETVNQNLTKLDELINNMVDFSEQTVRRVEYYRDQLTVPITEIISVWEGFKRGCEVFNRFRKAEKSDSGSNSRNPS